MFKDLKENFETWTYGPHAYGYSWNILEKGKIKIVYTNANKWFDEDPHVWLADPHGKTTLSNRFFDIIREHHEKKERIRLTSQYIEVLQEITCPTKSK